MPIEVAIGADGRPHTVVRGGRLESRAVSAIQDCWRIDDEWWREHAVSRMYYALLLDDGSLLSVYHDLLANTWHEQRD